jgi:allantoin racemase
MSSACTSILSQARQAIDCDGAEAIVLGCTGMSPVTKHLQENLEVPVVDPAVAALTLAESLVRMGLSHSRTCYLAPPAKKVQGEMYKGWRY